MLQKLGELQYEYMQSLEAQVIGVAHNLDLLQAITAQYMKLKRERQEEEKTDAV
jgi:hypothetical protein